jgi:serine/threonine-protein kinase ATR
VEEFAGPTAWLESRMKFSRTLAVMSFVGYVLGLGDRHSENILLDATTGAAVHVDFNCLFEKVNHLSCVELTNRVKASKNRKEFHFV